MLSDAAAMDAEMAKQRALYKIFLLTVRPTRRFSSVSMAPAAERPGAGRDDVDSLGVVVRPALLRRGTASGHEYKRPTYLIEMDVWLVYADEEQARAGRADNAQAQRTGEHQQGGAGRASMDVRRGRADEGAASATARKPVQGSNLANTLTVGGSDAAAGSTRKGTWYTSSSHYD
jgi:hypothetical protein